MSPKSLSVMLAAAICAALPLTGTDAVAAPGSQTYLLGSTGSPPGVSSLPVGPTAPVTTPAPNATQPMFSLQVTDPVAAEKSRRRTGEAQPDSEAGPYYCTPFITRNIGSVGEDDFLEETVNVTYYGQVDCNIYLDSIEAVAGVFDRSAAFNGETFDGRVLGTGTYYYSEFAYTGWSTGALGIRARDYNGGRRIEPAFEMFLLAPLGVIWGSCNPLVGLRYLACDGLGTDYLHVVVGTGNLQTGLTKACRDQRGNLNPEQDRLVRTVGGTTPVSTQLIRRVQAVKDRVTSFKRDLCAVTTAGGATTFADQRGLDLWNAAVAAAKAGVGAGDDRPLYWGRLAMTAALRQYRPTFTVDRSALQTTLDKSARGMTSHWFGGSTVKAFVSGFDPFGLEGGGITGGNSSGAMALQLDGTVVSGAEVQAVVFPVRYDDFDSRLVEDVFQPHLQAGSQQATIITTVSLGGSGVFELEFYNGRRRSTTFPDNRGRAMDSTVLTNPALPANIDPGFEFVHTTLPVDRMTNSFTVVDQSLVQKLPTSVPPYLPTNSGPTIGSTAVSGSGSGFLSNEIAYRVTNLRDRLKVPVRAGHVHTPDLVPPNAVIDSAYDTARNLRVNQFKNTILPAGIANVGVAPFGLTVDRPTGYTVGQTPVYTLTGAPANKQVLWSSTRNGVLTSENNQNYGHLTSSAGTFTGSYHSWSQAGTWVKYARIDGRLTWVTITVT